VISGDLEAHRIFLRVFLERVLGMQYQQHPNTRTAIFIKGIEHNNMQKMSTYRSVSILESLREKATIEKPCLIEEVRFADIFERFDGYRKFLDVIKGCLSLERGKNVSFVRLKRSS
jgi:hypothetical protein